MKKFLHARTAAGRQPRLLIVTLLLAGCGQTPLPDGPGGGGTGGTTPTPPAPVVVLKWSDPATWQALGQPVPAAGATVTIPAGKTVLLDADTPDLGGLHVNGTLNVAGTYTDTNGNGTLDLTSNFVMVHGELRAGSEQHPHPGRFTVTLTGSENRDVTGMNMGAKVLGVMDGQLNLFGRPTTSWVRLNATVPVGGRTLTLDRDVNWRAGDRVIVTATNHKINRNSESNYTEVATVQSVQGRTMTLESRLSHEHWGELQTIEGYTVDQRAEVALLTRDIVVQGDEGSAVSGFGGHTMVMGSGRARLHHVEFRRMGQKGVLARYPVHFHMQGERHVQADGIGNEVVGSSIHHSFNRFMSVHGTDSAQIRNSVGYDTLGHGFFLEDAAERFNVFEGNLGVLTRDPGQGHRLLPSDTKPAVFWISNPMNAYRGNVAVNSDAIGFWYDVQTAPTGLSAGRTDLKPSRSSMLEFTGNRAHSNLDEGLLFDNFQPPEKALVRDYASHHDGSPLWMGANVEVSDFVFSDQRRHAVQADGKGLIRDGVWIGRTANAPKVGPVQGTDLYGGRVALRDVTFVDFSREPGSYAITVGEFTGLVSDDLSLENVRFVNSNEVRMTSERAQTNGRGNQVVRDRSGILTGTPGTYLVTKDAPIALTPNCTLREEWNAHICQEHYQVMRVRPIGNDQTTFIRRDDGVMQEHSDGEFTVISGRSYTVVTQGSLPTGYDLSGSAWWLKESSRQAGQVFRVALPLAQAPTVVKRQYSASDFRPAGSLAQAEADATGNLYYYDPTTRLLHLKVVYAQLERYHYYNIEIR